MSRLCSGRFLKRAHCETLTLASLRLTLAFLPVRFQVRPQAPHHRFFLPFFDLFLHLFQSEVNDIMVMKFFARQHFAEAQP